MRYNSTKGQAYILVCTYSLAGEARRWHLLALNLQRVQSYCEGGGATAAGEGSNVSFIKVWQNSRSPVPDVKTLVFHEIVYIFIKYLSS